MEDNYLIQSKIHTRAIVTLMENIVAKKSASISDYHDIFIHWISWFHINEAMYDNLSNPNKGEHLEVTLAKLRVTIPGFESCARMLLNDIVSIMSIYRSNTEFFSSLYQNRETLRDMMWDHVNELDKKFDPTMEILAKRRKVDYELERLLCMYRRDTKMYYKALDELETKYTVTINPDNPQFWFSQSEDMYREHDKKYNEFLNYKGRCMTSVSSNYAECAFMTAERIHNVLCKEIEVCSNVVSSCNNAEDESKSEQTLIIEERPSAAKVYLNGDTCQSFYRSGAVDLFLANCSEENFYQLMNLNLPDPETGIKLIYADGLYYVLRILKDFLIDKGQTQDWINGVLESFGKNYKTFEAHSNDVFTDSEKEKSGAYKLYPIVKDWLKFRKEA
ncbi:MAG: hypothetical protein IKV05_03140 [Bacteroidales bacterium]|nr:hypothetical protein [Bacteroidales bacterium]